MAYKLITGALLAAASTASLAQVAPSPVPAPTPRWAGAQRAETRAEVVQRTQALFARLDRNRDGAITQDELAMAGDRRPGAPGMMPPPPPPPPPPGGPAGPGAAGMFDRVDLNHDGVITRDEFAQAHARMAADHAAPGPGPMARHGARADGREQRGMGGRMVMMADANRDGRITLQEMTAAALQRFDRMDLNHDGTVTPEERAQARAAWGQRRS